MYIKYKYCIIKSKFKIIFKDKVKKNVYNLYCLDYDCDIYFLINIYYEN